MHFLDSHLHTSRSHSVTPRDIETGGLYVSLFLPELIYDPSEQAPPF